MAGLVDKLTASGGAESVGFLNDIVAHLWPNISIAGGKMTKEIAEPMFAEMLPGPLAGLKFTKIDLGTVPMRFSNVDVHKTDKDGILLVMDLDWDGECDIDLDGNMLPKIGVQHVKLSGRLSVLLCPLTNEIPLIGAAQVAFINPPYLKLDFTDAANIADCALIDKCVRKVMQSIIASMAVVPNRFLVKLDAALDYFKAYQDQEGILRLTIEKASGIATPKGGNFLTRLVKDVPDCFCEVKFAGEEWKTSVKKNENNPEWNETHDFVLSDHDQAVFIDVQDDDLAGDDDIGLCETTIRKLLLAGGTEELALVHKGKNTSAKLTLSAKFWEFVPDISSFSAEDHQGDGKLCGQVTILIAHAKCVQGPREDLKVSVKATWGEKTFTTPVKTDVPGVDINNPSFDSAFRLPLTQAMVASPGDFKLTLMNGQDEVDSIEIPFSQVLEAPDMIFADDFECGSAKIRASLSVKGVKLAE